MVKVSVIVPVYNAEHYLQRCVDSLLSQTLQDIEIILVDDGSTDASGAMCDGYALKDPKVKVYHQSNCGVAAARQKGIEVAQGEYTIHADADDWVDKSMLQELWEKAQCSEADMVICDYFEEYEKESKYITQKAEFKSTSELIRALFQQLHGSCCNKLVKRACYNNAKIRFNHCVNYCEDLLFNIELISTGIKVVYLPKAFYHYDQYSNQASLVKGISLKKINSRIQVVQRLEQILNKDLQLYQDLLYHKKAIIKDDVFFGDYLDSTDFIHLFEEINTEYIHHHLFPKDKRPLQNAVSLALKGHYSIAQKLFKIYKWIRKA